MRNSKKNLNLTIILESLLKLKANGHLFAPGDLNPLVTAWSQDALPICFLNVNPLVVNRENFVPALSFYLKSGEMRYFNNKTSFKDFVKYNFDIENFDEIANSKSIVLVTQHYYVLTYKKLFGHPSDKDVLSRIVDEYCSNSLYLLNIEQDHYRLFYKKSYQIVSDNRRTVQSQDLPSILKRLTGFRSILLYSSPFNQFFINPKQQDAELLDELKGMFQNHHLQDSIIKFSLDATVPSIALRSAASFGKPQFFDQILYDQHKINAVLFPVFNYSKFVKSFRFHIPIQSESRDDTSRELVREVLFIVSIKPFSKQEIISLSAVIDAYTQYRFSDSRLELIRLHRTKLHNLTEQFLKNEDLRYSHLKSHFADLSKSVLQDILLATSAHSATVRIYDHDTQSLLAVAKANDTEGEYDLGAGPSKIRITENKFTSVNVFAYLNFKKFQYIYLPHVYLGEGNTPEHGSSKKFSIPKKYTKLKFRAPLTVRKSTRAEICFPLCYNGIPVGTLNLESPLPYSFDQDIEYIALLKSELEYAFEKTLAYTDVRNQDYQIQIYAAVHELDSYIRLNFFNAHQISILKSLFPLRDSEAEQLILAFDLRSQIDEWIDEIYTEQSEQSRVYIKNIVHIRSIDNSRLSVNKYSAIFFIIKNMVLNIVSHGDDQSSRVIVDDSPYYGVGSVWEVRIFCTLSPTPDGDTLDRLGISPILSNKGYRHGMFLVGVMTKVSGGFFYVQRNPQGSSSSVLVRLPYGKENPDEVD